MKEEIIFFYALLTLSSALSFTIPPKRFQAENDVDPAEVTDDDDLMTDGETGEVSEESLKEVHPTLHPGMRGYTLVSHQAAPSYKKRGGRQGQIVIFPTTPNVRVRGRSCPNAPRCSPVHKKYRSEDGRCNNLDNPTFGQSNLPFIRLVPRKHNLINCGAVSNLPNARVASSLSFKRGEMGIQPSLSLMFMSWGQIIDHDIELTPPRETPEGEFLDCCAPENRHSSDCCPLVAPNDDPFYGKEGRPMCMPFLRSLLASPGACSVDRTPDIANANTPWIDGSFVYGSDVERVRQLRKMTGGLLKTSEDKRKRVFPPITFEDGVKMEFGDTRGDVHPAATMLTTVFLRNHNKLARQLQRLHPNWQDEQLYQEARKINSAIIQHITYTDFMDEMLGRPNNVGLTHIKGQHRNFYNASLDGAISMGFGTAGFRLHTYVSGFIDLRDRNFNKYKTLKLRDIFHNALITMNGNHYDDVMRGQCGQPLHSFDNVFSAEMTEWLFRENQDNFGLDIAALNIQRGRDHQIPGYPTYREFCDLGKVKAWRDYTDLIPGDLVHRLVHIYKSPEDVDLYVAGNMESPVEGSLLGPTFHCLVREQFERLRDADRFFYTNPGHFTRAQLATIAEQTLSRVLCDNADDPASMRLPKNIFRLANDVTNPLRHCTDKVSHPTLNVNAWR